MATYLTLIYIKILRSATSTRSIGLYYLVKVLLKLFQYPIDICLSVVAHSVAFVKLKCSYPFSLTPAGSPCHLVIRIMEYSSVR